MSSRDILFIALALSALTITGFLAWFLYYLVAIVRDLRQTTKLLHEKVSEVGTILESIKERISESVSVLSLLTNAISTMVEKFRTRRAKRSGHDARVER